VSSQEIVTLITALGTGFGKDEYNADKLRYHRIIIMTDADVDGSHIRTLLLTFFYRQMPELVERGHIYIAQPPLYKVKQGSEESLSEGRPRAQAVPAAQSRLKGAELPHRQAARCAPSRSASVAREYLVADAVSSASRASSSRRRCTRVPDGAQSISRAKRPPPQRNALAGGDRRPGGRRAGALRRSSDAPARRRAHAPRHAPRHGDRRRFHRRGDAAQIRARPTVLSGPDPLRGRRQARRQAARGAVVQGRPRLAARDARASVSIQRYKGLGEMNPEQLWETTMDPASAPSAQGADRGRDRSEEIFSTLMGEQVEPRRAFIETNALGVRNLDV
jgi:DNA gyrase subunit B